MSLELLADVEEVSRIKDAVEIRVEQEQSEVNSPQSTRFPSDQLSKALDNNERGDSHLFIDLFKGVFCYDHSARRWFVWEDHYWQEDMIDKAMASMDRVTELYAEEAKNLFNKSVDLFKKGNKEAATELEEKAQAFLTRVRQLQTMRRRRNVLELAAAGEGSLGITGLEWDKRTDLIACTNGVLKLSDSNPVLQPGNPEDYIRTHVPLPWPDEGLNAKAENFETFLDQVFGGKKEIICYLQRFFGYALSGHPVEDVFIIFWGKGRNGKTTLLEIIKLVLGSMAGPIKAEMLLQQKWAQSSSGPNSDILSLRGKRLVWASETDEGRGLNLGKLKWLTGHDTLTGRPPYGRNEITFDPTHALVLSTNHKPVADPNDYALWQRLHLVPFNFSFVYEPSAPNERLRDPHLLDKLKEETQGILAWLVKGLIQYKESGLNPPDEVLQATSDYRKDEDNIAQFIEACCVRQPDAKILVGELYKAYQGWCDQEVLPQARPKTFKEYIIQDFTKSQRKTPGVYYEGIGLLDRFHAEGE